MTSSGSLYSANSKTPPAPAPGFFSFSKNNSSSSSSSSPPFMSNSSTTTTFSDLLNSDHDVSTTSTNHRGLAARIAERTGSGVPKFKSIPPPSLPISPPSVSPSSYFSIPAGLSPAELLDSPVLLSSNNVLPSPTTGSFPFQAFNWKSNLSNTNNVIHKQSGGGGDTNTNTNSNLKQEQQKPNSDFSFRPQTWNNYRQPTKPHEDQKDIVKPEYPPVSQSFSPEISTIQTNSATTLQSSFPGAGGNNYNQTAPRKSEDGFNWRKYGQKQVKGSENPRSYYKCTYPNCSMKKKVERSIEGQITEIVYKGNHNHPKPQNTRKSSSSSSVSVASQTIPQGFGNRFGDYTDHHQSSHASHGSGQMDNNNNNSVATPEQSSISVGDDEFDRSSQRSRSAEDEIDEDEPDAKRWRRENESEGISGMGGRTVREPRVVVQTTSDIDILDDGYKWRKYGQKVVKGNPNPRSYYKCTSLGCRVRKHVERASHDLRSVITTYEGKHNHDVPAARGSGNHSLNRPSPPPPSNNSDGGSTATLATIRHLPMPHLSNNAMMNPIRNSRLQPPTLENQSWFTQEMLQSPTSNFGNPMESYMNPQQNEDNVVSRAKEEPRDDLFFESLLC